ncbi:CpsD/CapB family tyrosine-protein kinase [Paenibacillus glycanilyticus]|uniref:CpsD/CapB family tyrosine-protein kinase n=1 Tax=Paenibacillus glycanilyticus TaxID=126569 RepID=UPI003EBE8A00
MKRSKKYIFATSTKSDLALRYREIKTNLYTLNGTGNPPSSILITSAKNGEGKTITASNLAVSFALDNRRVLIIDMNCANPLLHKIFSRTNTVGMSNYLQGTSDFCEAISETSIANLSLMPAGPEPEYLPALICSEKLKQLFQEAGDKYDVVIADGISSEEFAEIRLAASYFEGFIFVVNPRVSAREVISKQLKSFEHIQANLLGVVLNQM